MNNVIIVLIILVISSCNNSPSISQNIYPSYCGTEYGGKILAMTRKKIDSLQSNGIKSIISLTHYSAVNNAGYSKAIWRGDSKVNGLLTTIDKITEEEFESETNLIKFQDFEAYDTWFEDNILMDELEFNSCEGWMSHQPYYLLTINRNGKEVCYSIPQSDLKCNLGKSPADLIEFLRMDYEDFFKLILPKEYHQEMFGIEIDKKLIDDFYRSESLQPDNPEFQFELIDELVFDLNGNSTPDSIGLYRIKNWTDPGDFHQIRLKMDQRHVWTETNFEGWVKFDQNYTVPDKIKKQNQVNSDMLIVSDFNDGKIIGLFGWVYASHPGRLTFLEFSSRKPRVMLSSNLDLLDISNDRITTSFLEDKCWVEVYNNMIMMTCQ